ncbi:MFS transporter [Demetria terragena]|uniref:MFS transporter n=1 Tax=Demetria terragena TaxID=63959 RepID=UPI00035F55D4|nr:MFS transporter [Demetria terragena]
MTASAELVVLREPPPLRRDRLAHLWIGGRALSDAGDAAWTIAIAWTVIQIATPAVAGLIVAAGTIPRAAVLLYGGVLADRLDTRRIILSTSLIRVIILLGVVGWMLSGEPTVPLLVAAAVSFGLCDAIFDPASSTLARQLVRTEDLPAYMASMQTGGRLGSTLGAASGGALVAYAGLGGSASLNAVTFVLIFLVATFWLVPRFALPRAEPESPWRAVRGGFRHLKQAPTTRSLVIALSGVNLAVTPASGIGIALRAKEAGWGASSVGLLTAMGGLGAAVGAIAVIRWRPPRPAAVGFGALIVQGVGIAALGVGPVWTVGAAAFVIGITAGVASALISAVFAATVDGAYLGRMSSILRLGDDCLMPLALAGFGALASTTQIWVPFAVYGAGLVLAALRIMRNRDLMAL